MVRPAAQGRPGERPGGGHARPRRPPHPPPPRVPGELPVRAALRPGRLAEDREGVRDGGRRDLHGAADAQGVGERLHRRGGDNAVRGERGEGPGQGAEEGEGTEGVQQEDGRGELQVAG